jgi:protoheme IX farnesyltransferase
MLGTVKLYYSLTKPGVTYGNAITAVAGFLFAAGTEIEIVRFLGLTFGITFIIASACVINNYLDQDIDALMERTKARALVGGKLPGRSAVIFSIVLGLVGVGLLYSFTNALTAWVAIFGWFAYVVLYGMLAKRLSIHGTLVGSISGAIPILAGYTSVTGRVDLGGILLFLILFLWQMPEFYSIAVYRRDEYAKAKIPVMSVIKGIKSTKLQILVYTVFFVIATLLLPMYGYAGYVYAVVMTLLGVHWIWLGIEGQRTLDDNAWARRMFRFSLVILLVFSGLISLEAFLP